MYESESDADLEEKTRLERQEIVARYDLGRDEGAKIDDWEDPKLEFYHKQDRWGFIHDERLPDSKTRTERERKQTQVEVSRAQKWAEMINQENVKKYFGNKAKYREKMINRVHKGVPDSVRGKFWYILLDLDDIKKQQAGKYQEMRNLARKYSTHIRQIDLDVNRTYREHDMFRERYNGRQQALFHVLAAYSVYNSEVGYCQGMSQIAALFLMYLIDEEDAFWALSQLMVDSKYAMHGMFIIGFPKLMRLQSHHDKVLKKFLPRLKKHLDKNGIDTGLYTLKWFFQCFLDRVPFSIAIRVWDLFLLEGERVLTAMAYNILRMHRRYIMRLGMDELIEHLQLNLGKDFGYEDDIVIEKLRDVMHELRSSRLDYAGRPPAEELPQVPFGLIPTSLYPLPKESLGVRMPLSEKEREISTTRIMQIEANEEGNGKMHTYHGKAEYLTKQISLAEGDQSLGDEDSGSNDNIGGGNDELDTSFDVSADIILPNDCDDILTRGFKGDRTSSGSRGIPSNVSFYPEGTSSPQHKRRSGTTGNPKYRHQSSTPSNSGDTNVQNSISNSNRSPLPPSEAQDRLDDSVRMLLEAADGLNGQKSEGHDGDIHRISMLNISASSVKSNASHPSSSGRTGLSKPNHDRGSNSGYAGMADTSFGSGGGSSLRDEDIVRIRVPYNREDAEKMAALASADKNVKSRNNEELELTTKQAVKTSENQDRNKIVLTVNHKEESQHSRKSVAPNKSKSPTKSNKTTGNGPYATQNTTTSNGSPEESNLSSPSLVLSRSADQVDRQGEPDRTNIPGTGHQETTTSLNRRRQDRSTNNNATEYHHPHYNHHRTSSSKMKEKTISSPISKVPNSSYQSEISSPPSRVINANQNRTDKYSASPTMQNVITSTSSSGSSRAVSDIKQHTTHKTTGSKHLEEVGSMQQLTKNQPNRMTSDGSMNVLMNKDQNYAYKLSGENATSSGGVVKRTQNMVITSPMERNSKPTAHETYQIEEML